MTVVFEIVFTVIITLLGIGAVTLLGLYLAIVGFGMWDRLTRKAPRE